MAFNIMQGFSVVTLLLTALPCACSRVTGPPLPDRPFITVWNTPTDNCTSNWNVTLDLSAFDFVVNPDQTWRGEYIVIFYNHQLGLFPYFDSDGKAVNGGLPQVEWYSYLYAFLHILFVPKGLYGIKLRLFTI